VLQLLNISNIALIDDLRVEFDSGLNLLTGETGSGKSIIVDALGILIGGRFTADLLRTGTERGFIEGLFSVAHNPELQILLDASGLSSTGASELIIRRELSSSGRNKIFINNQLATQTLLRDLRQFLVDIHGQGDQQTLFNPETHLKLLDSFAAATTPNGLRQQVAEAYHRWNHLKRELDELQRDEAEKFQLVDILRFQIQELESAQLSIGEDESLEDERRRLLNVEKLTSLSQSSYSRIYEDDDAALARIRQTSRDVAELAEYDSRFREYLEGLDSASAVIEDLAFSLRNFSDKLEFSPRRLAEIEDRLAELARLKRKYGGSVEAALEHLARSGDRLRQVERSDEREKELKGELEKARGSYLDVAHKLHDERVRAARKFERAVERGIAEVAMDHARFQVQLTTDDKTFTDKGIDTLEFYFSANVGEDLKPLSRVASGGEASRLMLVLKTMANASEFPRTIVFDEIDTGIGGRVSEAVGAKLKKLSQTNQVLCVTHQPQIARFADSHLVVQKETLKGRTQVGVAKLDRRGRVEELARMLTGSEITDNARRHAREMLKI
jgi:DNA repair protein RecN (Recombination protein N)